MDSEFIQDGGCLVGSRINVYTLLIDFLEPSMTEGMIAHLYDITPKQIAAARAYIFNHLDEVLTQHLKIEARHALGNPPEVVEKMKASHGLLLRYREWINQRNEEARAWSEAPDDGISALPPDFPTFHEWLAQSTADAIGTR